MTNTKRLIPGLPWQTWWGLCVMLERLLDDLECLDAVEPDDATRAATTKVAAVSVRARRCSSDRSVCCGDAQ